MRRSCRAIMSLVVAIMASTVVTGVQPPQPADALTTTIWRVRPPNSQRLADSALSANGSIGFLASTHSFANTNTALVWRTSDSGMSWAASGNIPPGSWESVATSGDGGTVVALGTKASGSTKSVMVSIDSGDTWHERTPVDPNPSDEVVFTVHHVDVTADGSHIALATSAGIRLSANNGNTWIVGPSTFTFTDEDSARDLNLLRLEIGKTNTSELVIHANLGGYAIYTEKHGASVTQSGWMPSGGELVGDVAASDDGSVVLAISPGSGSGATLYISRNGGTSWPVSNVATHLTDSYTRVAVSGDGTRRVALGYGNTILESRDPSNDPWTWTPIDSNGDYPWMSPSLSSTGIHFLVGTERSGEGAFMQLPTPAPSISSLEYRGIESAEVIFAPESGGGELDIKGENFHDITSITIGGVGVSSHDRVNDTLVRVPLPAKSPGVADIVVSTEHGTVTLSGVLQYYSLVAPIITAVSETSGHFTGGTEVNFTGDGLAEVTSARFGDYLATIVSQSRNGLVVTAPVNRIGVMNITLTNPTGTTVLNNAWTSTWVSQSEDPAWSRIQRSENSPFDYSGPRIGVSSILPDDEGGFYVFGNFEELGGERGTDYAAHWNGTSWNPVGEDGNGLSVFDPGSGTSLFGGKGILTATRDNAGSIWVGGEFKIGGQPANIARINSSYGSWWVPSAVPDGRVTSITPIGNDVIVGGDFGPLTGVATSSRLARLSPDNDGVWRFSDNGVWSGIGSDGSGGSAIKNDGSLFGNATKTVQDVLVGPNGSVLAAGSFQLASTTSGHDLVAEFDGTTWQTLIPSNGLDVATTLARGVINGIDTTVVGICVQSNDGVEFERARVVSIVNGVATTIGNFDDCVRDVAIVGDAVIAAGWFGRLVDNGVPTVRMRNLAVFQNSEWMSLSAGQPLDSVTVFDDYHLAVSTYQTDGRIGGVSGTDYMARFGPIRELVGRATPLTVTNVSPVRNGEGLTVTVTGTGFTSESEVTLENRPAVDLVITSETSLRFTASWSDSDRQFTVYGRTSFESATLSPPPPATVLPPQNSTATSTTTAITPANILPSNQSISTFPAVKLLAANTQLYPKASFTVSAGGFVPGEEVWVLIASTPQQLRTATASSKGTVSAKITLPSGLVGRHTLAIWSPTTGRGVRQAITIAKSAPSSSVKAGKNKSASTIMRDLKISVPKKSKLSLTVQTPKVCRAVTKTTISGIKKGKCRATVKITPQKGKAITKRVVVTVK